MTVQLHVKLSRSESVYIAGFGLCDDFALFAVQTTLTDVNLVNSKEMENGLNLGIPLVACTFRNGAATVLLRQPPYRCSQLCKTSVCNLHIRNHLHT